MFFIEALYGVLALISANTVLAKGIWLEVAI